MDQFQNGIIFIAILIGGIIGVVIGLARKKKEKPERISPEEGIVPCPECSNKEIIRLKYTWWGGALGPKLFHLVKCPGCDTTYNGKTGRSTRAGIAVYFIITLIIAFLIGLFINQNRFF